MTTDARTSFDGSTRRVEELVFALGALPDPAAAAAARELVQLILELHGNALGRVMETLAADSHGTRLATALAQDDVIGGVLLLHGLHPAALEDRVRAALDRLRPVLGVQGVAVQDVQITGDAVRVRLESSDAGRYAQDKASGIRRDIEQAVCAAAPEAGAVEVIGLPVPVAVVPLSSITVRRRPEAVTGAS